MGRIGVKEMEWMGGEGRRRIGEGVVVRCLVFYCEFWNKIGKNLLRILEQKLGAKNSKQILAKNSKQICLEILAWKSLQFQTPNQYGHEPNIMYIGGSLELHFVFNALGILG